MQNTHYVNIPKKPCISLSVMELKIVLKAVFLMAYFTDISVVRRKNKDWWIYCCRLWWKVLDLQ